jgi:hypothetical protein
MKLPRLETGKTVAEEISKKLEESGLLQGQDGVAILFALNSLPKNVKPKVSTKIWQYGDPLHASNLQRLNKALRNIQIEDDKPKVSGTSKTEPHFIWTFILQRYAENSNEIVGFKSLWDTVVESIQRFDDEFDCRWFLCCFIRYESKISRNSIICNVPSSNSGRICPSIVFEEFLELFS